MKGLAIVGWNTIGEWKTEAIWVDGEQPLSHVTNLKPDRDRVLWTLPLVT